MSDSNESTEAALAVSKTKAQVAQLKARLANPNLSPANKLLLGKLVARLEKMLPDSQNTTDATAPKTQTQTQTPAQVPTAATKVVEEAYPSTAPEEEITFNSQQQEAISRAIAGESMVITGAAGTGKTTTLKAIVRGLILSGRCGVIEQTTHKYVRSNSPGVVILSYTNKAVQNVKRRLPHELHGNCMTAHKFLEYQPVFETEVDEDTAQKKTSSMFVATRDQVTPNPASIRVIIVDEATMLDVPLWNEIIASMPRRTAPDIQVILMGDIQQLPPVFGKSIFIHALQSNFPVVELTEVYRQALENPILALAHRILSGKVIGKPELSEWNIDKSADGKGKLTIIPWKKKLSDVACNTFLRHYLPKLIDSGGYDPEEDVILCPFNVNIGTLLLNNIIAGHVARSKGLPVHEIYTGTKKVYMRVGERVLHNKSEAIVTSIKPNFQYFGKPPRAASPTMDYEGMEHNKAVIMANTSAMSESTFTGEDAHEYVDRMLEAMGSHVDDDSPAKRAASHVVTVQSLDTGDETKLSSAGDINYLLLGYAITVHKSQGSEYNRVIFLTHHTHATMCQREILYVAVTRAKQELVVICEPNLFVQGITSQKLPGRTIAEKVEAFETALRMEQRRGAGNIEQMPRGFDRLLKTVETEPTVEVEIV